MTAYVLRRLIGAAIVIFGVATISFVMVFMMPGDAARAYGERRSQGRGPARNFTFVVAEPAPGGGHVRRDAQKV